MKGYFGKSLVVALVFLATQAAFAGGFGWSTVVVASNGINVQSQGVTAPSHEACENARQLAVNTFTAMGYSILSAPSCIPVAFNIPEELLIRDKIRWPWPGPGCLSCPYLTLENIKVIYPERLEKVTELVERYEVNNYNAELVKLQDKYQIGKFEEQMYGIELEQALEGQY